MSTSSPSTSWRSHGRLSRCRWTRNSHPVNRSRIDRAVIYLARLRYRPITGTRSWVVRSDVDVRPGSGAWSDDTWCVRFHSIQLHGETRCFEQLRIKMSLSVLINNSLRHRWRWRPSFRAEIGTSLWRRRRRARESKGRDSRDC